MARRDDNSAGLNLDSLMDTLTNVVGILVIILLFTSLNAADAVRRVKGFVDEISDAQLAKATAEAEKIRELLEQSRRDLAKLDAEAPAEQRSLQQQRELTVRLKQDLEKLAASKLDIDQVRKQLEEQRTRVKAIEEDIVSKEKEMASLKARLADESSQVPNEDAKIVTIPDPRDAPQGAKRVVLICRHGRIVPVDTETLQAKAGEALEGASRAVVRQNAIDGKRLAEIFEKRYVGDRNCQLKIRIGGDAKPYLAVEPRPDAADKTDAVAKPASRFSRLLRDLDPNAFYLDFRVYGDSFDTYIGARALASRLGFSAGWVPYAADGEYWISFGPEMTMTCLGKEPPKPAPPDPNQKSLPPAPADVVD